MVHILNITDRDDVLDVKISGNLSKEDYKKINPRIEEKIKKHGKINLLFELENVNAAGIGSMWEEFKFNAKHFNDINKIAVVGDQISENVLANIKKTMTFAETKFFKKKDRDTAIHWL